jgi:hypothetical protein
LVVVNPLPGWLAEVTTDAVVVCPDDLDAEACGNMWSFSFLPEQAAAVSEAKVVEFLQAIAAARGRSLAAQGTGPMLLYCWNDQQAGQLRLSLVSASHGRLPFGCEVVPVEDLGAVVRSFLGSPHLGGIPWSELRPLTTNEVASKPFPHVLPVWIARVP